MKTYRGDLIAFQNQLKNRQPFAFSRFGDGELRILMGQLNHYPEFRYDPSDPAYAFLRERLLESFRYKSETYHVGISCPKCVGEERFLWAKQHSGQTEQQLTWATLFVNSNYSYYRDHVIQLFADYRVFLVCNRSASLESLPFPVVRDFRIENNAWQTNFNLANQIAERISRENIEGALFLFCAGPFANILTHKLHERSKKNTYLDVGSTLSRGFTRRYLRGEKHFLQETCIWK
jgi:hypothetical protein